MHTHKKFISIAIFLSLLPWPVEAQGESYEQDFVLTAYYSPLPDQCCYVLGSLAADIQMNGEGHHGADGTAVYPGMIAAPPSYAFGTRIVLPGIGTVTVHDRGGAIQEWKDAHRLDVWVGYGEEGLARALAFGVQRVRGTIYPVGSDQPVESINLAALPSPPKILQAYMGDETTLIDLHPKMGEQSASVLILQNRLKDLGYFAQKPNGQFGPGTSGSLQAFYDDMHAVAPVDSLTENGAALIEAAWRRRSAKDPIGLIVEPGSAPSRIAEAQRIMRFLGFYQGRTNGQYDDTFRAAVLTFQKKYQLVGSQSDTGAGRIGPMTRKEIARVWKARHAHHGAVKLLAMRRIDQLIADKGYDLAGFLKKGDRGSEVRLLQNFLVSKGFLSKSDVNGNFGALTEQALTEYQVSKGIIENERAPGAGFAGPATLLHYRRDMRKDLLRLVRAKGWEAI